MSEEVPVVTELVLDDILCSIMFVLFCFGDCFSLSVCMDQWGALAG